MGPRSRQLQDLARQRGHWNAQGSGIDIVCSTWAQSCRRKFLRSRTTPKGFSWHLFLGVCLPDFSSLPHQLGRVDCCSLRSCVKFTVCGIVRRHSRLIPVCRCAAPIPRTTHWCSGRTRFFVQQDGLDSPPSFVGCFGPVPTPPTTKYSTLTRLLMCV